MKIISTYKDYYDYLSGIYGADPLVVLDRRTTCPKPVFLSDIKLRLYIGGYLVEAWYAGGQAYYGNTLDQFVPVDKHGTSKYRFPSRILNFDTQKLSRLYGDIRIPDSQLAIFSHRFYPHRYSEQVHVLKTPIADSFNINEKENCPIILKVDNETYQYPKLEELGLTRFLSADVVYRWISDWLSLQRTKAENHVDTRTNIEKIESDGFDKITSFRK